MVYKVSVIKSVEFEFNRFREIYGDWVVAVNDRLEIRLLLRLGSTVFIKESVELKLIRKSRININLFFGMRELF